MELETSIFLLIILISLAVAVRVFFKRKERQYLRSGEAEYGLLGAFSPSKTAAPSQKRFYGAESSKSKIDSLFPDLDEGETRRVLSKPIIRRGEVEIAANAPVASAKTMYSHRDEAAMLRLKKMKQQAVENVRLKYGDEIKTMPKLGTTSIESASASIQTMQAERAEPLKEEKAAAKEEPSAIEAFNKTMGFEKKKEEEKKKEDKEWKPSDFFNA